MRQREYGIRRASAVMAAAALVAASIVIRGQVPHADVQDLRSSYEAYRALAQSSPYAPVPWQSLGPANISGRATDVAVADRGSLRRIYAAYATSGVWKTDDNGATWQSIFDNYPSTSIGDLAVAPSNPDIVWVGTGES